MVAVKSTLLPGTMTEQVNSLSAPVYLKHAQISMIRGNILITICNATNRVTPNNIVAACKIRGIWQIAVKTQTARAQLLTQGISIDKQLVQLYDDNPYTHRTGETSEKIGFKELPFEFQTYHITKFFLYSLKLNQDQISDLHMKKTRQ